jgi:hypothetical protein
MLVGYKNVLYLLNAAAYTLKCLTDRLCASSRIDKKLGIARVNERTISR